MQLAAVLGGATGGLDELKRLQNVNAVFAVNDAAAEYPGELAAFVTLHPEKLPKWMAKRRAAGLPEPREVVAYRCQDYRDEAGRTIDPALIESLVTRFEDYRFPGMNESGSSGLFAVKVALERGFDRVVLCGVPMDAARAHYFNSAPWTEVEAFRAAWSIAKPALNDRVRSWSGWTATLLGTPTPEWLGYPAGGMPVVTSERL